MGSSVLGRGQAGKWRRKEGKKKRVGEHKQGGRGSSKAQVSARSRRELPVSNLTEKYKLNSLAHRILAV